MKVKVTQNESKNRSYPFKSGDIITTKCESGVVLLYISGTKQLCLKHYCYAVGRIDNWSPNNNAWELFDGEVTLSND